MPGHSEVAIVTSILPKLRRFDNGLEVGDDYQSQCVSSWRAAGLRVMSINSPEEIRELAGRYPHVEFVPTGRDARAISGRKNPFVNDLLSTLASQAERIVGIINSDVYLPDEEKWAEPLSQVGPDTVLIGQRGDVRSLSDASLKIYQDGFDYFFFDKRAIKDSFGSNWPFAMGLPWWDYWLPTALALRGCRIEVLGQPVALHLVHNVVWEPELWNFMGIHFLEYIVQYVERSTNARKHTNFGLLIEGCQKLAASLQFPWSSLKQKLLDSRALRQLLNQSIHDSWDEEFYLLANPGVAENVQNKMRLSGLQHFELSGRMEGRFYKVLIPKEWEEESYLRCNADVASAVVKGDFASGWDHYVRFGAYESRCLVELSDLPDLGEVAQTCLATLLDKTS